MANLAIVNRLRAAGCVFAEDEADLLTAAAASAADLDDMVARRVGGIPLEHIIGWAEFCGLRIAVAPGVFVPRRRTEFLVAQALALLRPGAVVADVCCGSGALGAALRAAVPSIDLYATDIHPAAVACARENLARQVFQGDLLDPLPPALAGRIDVVVANVPYVPTAAVATLPPEAREHEPLVALDGGADGLDVLRRLAVAATRWLARGGYLLVEASQDQAPAAVAVMAGAGLGARTETSDEWGSTVVIGQCCQATGRPAQGRGMSR